MSTQREEQSNTRASLASLLPLLISVLSLGVSFLALYYQDIREDHDLRAVVTRMDYDVSAKGLFTAQILLMNRGNQVETVFNTDIGIGPGASCIEVFGNQSETGPFILKPGDAKVYTAKMQYSVRDLAISKLFGATEQVGPIPARPLYAAVQFTTVDSRLHRHDNKIYRTVVGGTWVFHFVKDDKNDDVVANSGQASSDSGSFINLYGSDYRIKC